MESDFSRFSDIQAVWDVHRGNVDGIAGGTFRHTSASIAFAAGQRRMRRNNICIAAACAALLAASAAVQATAGEPALASGGADVRHAVAVANNITCLQ